MKKLEDILGTVLTKEQITALKEEIASGIRRINTIVDQNEKIKKRKETALDIMKKIDELVEESVKTPSFFKAFYTGAKKNIMKFVMPIIEHEFEKDPFESLDDLPDKKPSTKKPDTANKKTTKTDSDKKKTVIKKTVEKKGADKRKTNNSATNRRPENDMSKKTEKSEKKTAVKKKNTRNNATKSSDEHVNKKARGRKSKKTDSEQKQKKS